MSCTVARCVLHTHTVAEKTEHTSHRGGALQSQGQRDDAAEKKAITAYGLINERGRAIESILPPTISLDRFKYVTFQAFRANPRIMECDVWSVLGAVMECCKVALMPNTPGGLCYLVPTTRFGTSVCEFWIGYQGAKVLACRDGDVGQVWARVVHENDPVFRVIEGSAPSLEHTPLVVHVDGRPIDAEGSGSKTVDPRGPLVAAYAVARYRDTRLPTRWAVMPRIDVVKIRDKALASKRKKDQSPWVAWESAMWRKSAVKRLCKELTLPDAAREAIALDGLAETGQVQQLGERFRELPTSSAAVPAGALCE